MKDIFSRKEWKEETNLKKQDLQNKFIEQLLLIDKDFNSVWSPSMIKAVARFAEYNVIEEDEDLLKRLKQVLKAGRSAAHVLRFGKIEGEKRKKEHLEKTTHTEDSFIKKYGEEEGRKKYREYCKSKSNSLENYIRRFGEEEGRKKYREYWDSGIFSTKLSGFIKRHGEEEGRKKYEEFCERAGKYASGELWEDKNAYLEMIKRRSQAIRQRNYNHDNNSLEAKIRVYGEIEGPRKYKEHIEKIKKTSVLSKERWIELGYSEDEAKFLVLKEQEKRQVKAGRASKASLVFFEKLIKKLQIFYNITNEDYYIGKDDNIEYFISDGEKFFRYDFTVPKLNLIVEFHGVIFHPKSLDDDLEKFPFIKNKEQLKEVYQRHKLKKQIALEKGFINYFEVFEDENYDLVIENILKELKNV